MDLKIFPNYSCFGKYLSSCFPHQTSFLDFRYIIWICCKNIPHCYYTDSYFHLSWKLLKIYSFSKSYTFKAKYCHTEGKRIRRLKVTFSYQASLRPAWTTKCKPKQTPYTWKSKLYPGSRILRATQLSTFCTQVNTRLVCSRRGIS